MQFDINLAISLYSLHGNVHKVGKELGVSGGSIHYHMKKLGLITPMNILSKDEEFYLIQNYENYASLHNLSELSEKMGRNKTFICGYAKKLGLTDKSRSIPRHQWEKLDAGRQKHFKEHGHPRGALGMTHSEEVKRMFSDKLKDRWKNMSESEKDAMSKRASELGSRQTMNRANASWKAAWREIGGIKKYYRSRWEANYARYLEWLKINSDVIKWEHESETFWFDGIKRGCMSYLPDFRIEFSDGRIEYHEVKGWMDDRSITKIKRMAKYHPNVKLVVIDSKAYKKLESQVRSLVDDWE